MHYFTSCLFLFGNRKLSAHVLVKWTRVMHQTIRTFFFQYPDPFSPPKLTVVTSARFWWSRIYVMLEGECVICVSFSELFYCIGLFLSVIFIFFHRVKRQPMFYFLWWIAASFLYYNVHQLSSFAKMQEKQVHNKP